MTQEMFHCAFLFTVIPFAFTTKRKSASACKFKPESLEDNLKAIL
jgi:hypothetical protein